MKITSGNNQVVFHEYGRIVGYGVDFTGNNGGNIHDAVLAGSMYLRYATERIGVLDSDFFLLLEFRAFQQSPDVVCCFYLTGMWACFLNLRQERVNAAIIGFQGKSSDNVGILHNFKCF